MIECLNIWIIELLDFDFFHFWILEKSSALGLAAMAAAGAVAQAAEPTGRAGRPTQPTEKAELAKSVELAEPTRSREATQAGWSCRRWSSQSNRTAP